MNKKGLLISVLLLLILFIGFSGNIRSIVAQGNDISLELQHNFELTQYSEIKGLNQSVDSINIQLPTSSWTIDGMELNFSDIAYGKESITIEDGIKGTFKRVYKRNVPSLQYIYGQAVQIIIDDPSIIYGVYIYGYNASHLGTPQIQIRGYNEVNHNPNGTIYASTNLNITAIEGWYLQKFSSPISLNPGNYYLVLNGSSIPIVSDALRGFYWAYNNIDPLYPQLNTSEFVQQWSVGTTNQPFLYKLLQKIDLPFFPEANNMTVKINDDNYAVTDGISAGEGYLKQANLNYYPGTDSINLNVYNNKTAAFNFNVSYQLNINQIITNTASVLIKQGISNKWALTPTINRYSNNESIIFHYPLNWINFTVYKDQVNISSLITINPINKVIILPNQTISNGAEWEITANSPNFLVHLNAPKTDYYLGQELLFSLGNPILDGNYTFILINSADLEEFRIVKTIPPEVNIFSYTLPLSSPDGSYIAYVFWNNQTDAGVVSQEFIISNPVLPPPDNTVFIIIISILIIAPGSAIGVFVLYRKLSKDRRYKMQRLLEKCVDILNLNYFIVTDTKSGIDIYSQSFGEQKGDSTLISGFLQAVRAFGSEVAADKDKTVKIQYKNSILLMTEFVNVRLILNMKAEPSVDFHYAVESLAYDVYKHYGKLIDEFHGNIKDFQGIKDLVEQHLNVSFIYPLKVEVPDNVKLNSAEKEMVEKAKKFIEDYDFDHIYALYLLPENECSPKDAQTVLNLIKKGVFIPQK